MILSTRFRLNCLICVWLLALGSAGCGGEDGAQGSQGVPGEQGSVGELGPQGPTGSAGLTGSTGPMGEAGTVGETGPAGDDGPNGEDGTAPLIETRDLAPGEQCPYGGVLIIAGEDTDGNGELGEDEISFSETLCHAASTGCASEGGAIAPLTIEAIDDEDQRFFEGIESAPMTVQTNAERAIELTFLGVGPELAVATDEPGQFTVTPPVIGDDPAGFRGPFHFIILATDGCTIAQRVFIIDEVEPALVELFLVHLHEDALGSPLRLAMQGEQTQVPFQGFLPNGLSTARVAALTPLPSGSYQFDALDADGNVIATSPEYELEPGKNYTLATHAKNGELAFILLEDDKSPLDEGIRVRFIHAADGLDTIDVVFVDGTTDELLADDLPLGQASAAYVLDDAPKYEFALRDLPSNQDELRYVMEEGLVLRNFPPLVSSLDETMSYNLFTTELGGEKVLFVQLLNNEYSPSFYGIYGPAMPTALPESFSSGALPSTFVHGGARPLQNPTLFTPVGDWNIDDEVHAEGTYSLRYDPDPDAESTTSWLEASFEVTEPGTLYFDWKANTAEIRSPFPGFQFVDEAIFYCVNRAREGCTPITTTSTPGADGLLAGDVDWQTQAIALEPGLTTIRWYYVWFKLPSPVPGNAWIDNIRFEAN